MIYFRETSIVYRVEGSAPVRGYTFAEFILL